MTHCASLFARPLRAAATAALVALLAAALLAGCAGKQEQQAVTAPIESAQTEPAPARQPQPDEPPAGRAMPAPEPRKTAPREQQAAATAAETPARRMLAGAGRDPDAAQPEAGFVLRVPGAVRDGEPFLVEFGAEGAEKLTLSWRGKNLELAGPSAKSGLFQALLPVALNAKEQSIPLTMTVHWAGGRTERFSADMPVRRKKYPVQKLNVDQKFVSPPPEMAEKIKRDRAEMRAAVSKVSPVQYWTLPLLRPVPGEVTSLYGLRRVFNGVPKNPHRGVDFDAREGDPIAALEDGVVVLVADHYYSGNIVVVDHGLGVMSAYLHLSDFNVAPGERVLRGDTVGSIGSTGRVTGPHLHLSFYVLGESVNAAACIAM